MKSASLLVFLVLRNPDYLCHREEENKEHVGAVGEWNA